MSNFTMINNQGGSKELESGSPNLMNSIIWNNSPAAPFYYQSDGTIDITYSNIEGGWSGTGNIDKDPLFTDPVNGDYTPQEPDCIDAADPSLW